MGRIFAFGDIHGRLTALNRLLDKLDVDRIEDEIVFLGDYIDRGPDSVGVLDRVIGPGGTRLPGHAPEGQPRSHAGQLSDGL